MPRIRCLFWWLSCAISDREDGHDGFSSSAIWLVFLLFLITRLHAHTLVNACYLLNMTHYRALCSGYYRGCSCWTCNWLVRGSYYAHLWSLVSKVIYRAISAASQCAWFGDIFSVLSLLHVCT